MMHTLQQHNTFQISLECWWLQLKHKATQWISGFNGVKKRPIQSIHSI